MLLPIILFLACTDGSLTKSDTGGATTSTDYDDTATTTTDISQTPYWWSLSAEILVENNTPDLQDTSIKIALFDEQSHDLCEVTASPSSIIQQELPDSTIYTWWQIGIGSIEGDCSQNEIPIGFMLGIGELHSELLPLLSESEYSTAYPWLYGAYLQMNGSDLWVYGITGSHASYDQDLAPVETAPIPNGTYLFKPLYLLPLDN